MASKPGVGVVGSGVGLVIVWLGNKVYHISVTKALFTWDHYWTQTQTMYLSVTIKYGY